MSCHVTDDRSAATWGAELAPLTALEFAVSDGARGIARAVADVAQRRSEADATAAPPEHGLDLFHTARDAHALATAQGEAGAARGALGGEFGDLQEGLAGRAGGVRVEVVHVAADHHGHHAVGGGVGHGA